MDKRIAIQLVQTGNLSVDQLRDVGNRANGWTVWQAVVDVVQDLQA